MEPRRACARRVPYRLGCIRGPLPDVVKGRVSVGAVARPALLDVSRLLPHRLPPRVPTLLILPIAPDARRWRTGRAARTLRMPRTAARPGHAQARPREAKGVERHQRERKGAHAPSFG